MLILRPSLRNQSPLRRWMIRTRELATPVARVGLLRVWSPIEDVTLRIGGPRVGKSGELACRILDAPGAVVATSTRTDLADLTAACRARRGPVWVFNPCGLGGVPSTITFDPLAGCEEPRIAAARAADLLAGADAPGSLTTGDGSSSAQARRVLTALLHAAAGNSSMRDVLAGRGPDMAAEVQPAAPVAEPLEPMLASSCRPTTARLPLRHHHAGAGVADRCRRSASAGRSVGRQVHGSHRCHGASEQDYRPAGWTSRSCSRFAAGVSLGAGDGQIAPLVPR
jgi:hypothetical protein